MSVSLILASVLLEPAAARAFTEPYRCAVPVEIGGLGGGVWRDFRPSAPDDFYIVQLNDPEAGGGPRALWSIDNRPPARPRVYGWLIGRPETVVFRQGPDSVSFGTVTVGAMRDGPVWAHVYGDGVFVGTYLQRTARETRRAARLRAPGVSIFVTQGAAPDVMARLAGAREWTAVLADSAGRELARRTIRLPTAAEVQAAFERARREIMRNRAEFLAHPTDDENAPCAFFPSPESTI